MNFKSYAKINLGLNVYKNKLENTNKHKIETIMLLVKDMHDIVNVEENDQHVVQYFENGVEIFMNDCLVTKTLNYLTSKGLIENFYKVTIEKLIPTSSGFGGGSSNAGTIISELLKLENKSISDLDMFEIANVLGSDIPFFVTGYKIAYVTGIGDEVKKIETNTNLKLTVYKNKETVQTANVFEEYLESKTSDKMNDYNVIIQKIINGENIGKVYNSLTDSCMKLVGDLELKIKLLKTKHTDVFLNGSGTSLIAIDPIRIRTRYAPSPTGYFHIGGARTAIFNYLFAKHNNGEFIVRIEDTDVERNVQGGAESQLNNLAWLNVLADESILNPGEFGPYIQSQKLSKYATLAEKLVKEGKAYYCFCTKDKLDYEREIAVSQHKTPRYQRTCLYLSEEEIKENLKARIPYTIRLKMNDNKIYSWYDVVRGKISVPGHSLTDPVILKSNKIAMYNFAVVVDDYDMNITHVLRGEEHISNTPYQLAIAEALGKDMLIKYGHLSVIVDETGKKLSKRNETLKQFIEDYQNMGCIPEALFNFLSLLGWSPENNKEILSMQEIINSFKLETISKAPAFFDIKKLRWTSNQYFKNMSDEEYLAFVDRFVANQIREMFSKEIYDEILLLFKKQIEFATDINPLINNLFFTESKEDIYRNMDLLKDHVKTIKLLNKLVQKTKEWTNESITGIINEIKERLKLSGKNLFMPIRLAATKLEHGPDLANYIRIIGKDRVLKNITICLETIK